MTSAHVTHRTVLVLGLALASSPILATAKTITVKPGQSIQAAVNAAKAGDTVRVLAGDYVESGSFYSDEQQSSGMAAVLINKPLTLTAAGHVRILGQPELTDGIVAEGSAGHDIVGLEIKGFVVEGFSNNGIKLAHVKNFNIENNVSIDNLENGIWPTLSANGQVKRNVAYGSKDSALWVEASENVRVILNDLAKSPTGLEVTLSKNLTIENNNVHDNTVGIGLYHPAAAGLPQESWPAAPYGFLRVANNYVHHNNQPNSVQEGEVAMLPPGLGMLILGTDEVDVRQNRVEKNDFVGIALLDWCVAAAMECLAEGVPPGFEDTALDNVRVVANQFAGNHTATTFPDYVPAELAALKSDIMYVDGLALAALLPGVPPLPPGTGNCQADNKLVKTPNPRTPGVLMYTVPSETQVGFDLFPTCQ